jgi:hypothetical protein
MSADTTKTRKVVAAESSALLWDPRALRKFWLDAMTQATDGYLRSSAFLELMQHGLKTMTHARTQAEDRSVESPSLPDHLSVEGDSHR